MLVMKQNFTKITLFFTLCLLSASLYGQRIYNVNVDGVATPLVSVSSTFPGPCTATLTGEMVAGAPANGCDPITNPDAIAGKIAVLDRGECNFTVKVRNAQAAGALAVIVCNNRPETAEGGGIFPMGGTDIDDLNTFSIMLSQESCTEFKANLPLNVSIEVDETVFDLTEPSKVIWGLEPGQGDFDGGLNGWSAVTIECNGAPSEAATWKYEADGISEGGLGNGGSTGPSFCNGAVGFNSDFLDNGGNVETNADGQVTSIDEGSGDCPAPQIGELISPLIDLSGSDVAGVSVEFYQAARTFTNTRFFVEYSIDGGENYVVAAEVNAEVAANQTATELKQTIPLPGAAGTSQLRVKFTMFGNYYYWVIDDVKIIEREANNLRVNENFFATAPNVKVPKSQVDAIHFLADIQNIGAATQENTSLNMTVTNDATGAEVFNSDLAYGSITADSIAENKLFESTFTPDDVVANYTGVYTVSSDSEDFDATDNTRTINFSVTENEFANEDGMNMGNISITDPSQIPTWSLGNYFYLPKGNGWKVAKFGIGIGNADMVGGLEVGVRMFKWTDIDADSDDSGFPEAAPNEREFIGFADYEILGNELPTDVNEITEIFNQDGDESPILLEDGGHYIVMMTMDAEVGVAATDALYNNYLAMNLASTQAGAPRYWSFFGSSSDIFETVYDANNNFTPLVRMFIEPEDASAVVELSADNLVTVGPNPAKEFVNIGMEFTQSFDEVNIMITDAAGRVVLMNDLQNIQNHQMRVDVSNLMAGIFLVNINTPEGVRTEKFIKVD